MSGAEVRYTVAEGRGMFATKDLAEGSVFVSAPASLAIKGETCKEDPTSMINRLPVDVVRRWARSPTLVVLCLIELEDRKPAAWQPYLASLASPEKAPLVQALSTDLNATFAGSQLLREVEMKMKEVRKLHAEIQEFVPSFTCPLDRFVATYALVETVAHSEVFDGRPVPAILPVIDILNHRSAFNAQLRVKGPATVEVVVTKDVKKGEPLYISYLQHHRARRASFFRQYAVDDTTLTSDLKLNFHLRPSDPLYAEKKLRFPKHMVEAKQLYADLAHLLPAEKRGTSSALAFPHPMEISCDHEQQPMAHPALGFLRFVVARRVPTDAECPGEPPICPFLDDATEKLAQRRLQLQLLEYRSEYKDFASPKAGLAAKLLDDERRCLDNFLTDAGAPPPPIVGLYSALAATAAICAFGLYRTQRQIWRKELVEEMVEH